MPKPLRAFATPVGSVRVCSDMKTEISYFRTRYHLLDLLGTLLVVAGLVKMWAKDGLIPDFIPFEYDGFLLLFVALCFYIPSTVYLIRKGIAKDRKKRQENQKNDEP